MKAFSLPADGRDAVVDDIRHHGRTGVESGAFLMTGATAEITVVALLGDDGVQRHPRLLKIDARVIDQLFTYGEDRELRIRAYIHSHGGEAFMSRTDKNGTIQVPGFIAGVVPHFADPPEDPSLWGWWTYNDGKWNYGHAPQLCPAHGITVVVADAGGVRER